jgi:hypothetical protein
MGRTLVFLSVLLGIVTLTMVFLSWGAKAFETLELPKPNLIAQIMPLPVFRSGIPFRSRTLSLLING